MDHEKALLTQQLSNKTKVATYCFCHCCVLSRT